MRLRFALFTSVLALASFARMGVAQADCTEAGACASNEYCAIDDGGVVVTDGGAGVCVPEPCVVSTDCPDNLPLCDTSVQPFRCVQCINTSDCSGDQLCNPATRTCVNPPPVDAGEDAGSEDAAVDAGEPVDATVPVMPTDGSAGDATTPATDAAAPLVADAAPSSSPARSAAAHATAIASGPPRSAWPSAGLGPRSRSGSRFSGEGAGDAASLPQLRRAHSRGTLFSADDLEDGPSSVGSRVSLRGLPRRLVLRLNLPRQPHHELA